MAHGLSKNFFKHRPAAIVSAGVILFTLTVIVGGLSVSSQTPPCTAPPIDPDGHPQYSQGDTVYCEFNSNITPDQRDQILRGLNSWSDANQSNNSGVRFVEGPPPAIGNGQIPAQTFFQNGTIYQNGSVATHVTALTTYNGTRPDGSIASTTITFNTGGALADPSNPQSGPYYNPNLPIPPGAPSNGYDTVFEKKTRHEVGHPLGLGDITGTQQPRGSVKWPRGQLSERRV